MKTKLASNNFKPVVLLILDGWGLSPSWGGNAIAMSNPPFINALWRDYPHAVLQAFRKVAGPTGKVANSEIGHSSIGCGRLVYQDFSRINDAIKNNTFFSNSVLTEAIENVKKNNSSLHLMGLTSDGYIHSHIDHLFALLKLAKQHNLSKVYVHCFLDGIDAPKTSALIYLTRLEKEMKTLGTGKISTIMGRFFAMDRDGNWLRTKKAYLALTKGKGFLEESSLHAVSEAYKRGFSDENVVPMIVTGETETISPDQLINNRDSVIFFNFRPDRGRQLTRAFADKNFRPFWCLRKPETDFVTLTQYQKGLESKVAFPPEVIKNSLPEILSQNKTKQLHVAESEKYAHITYFLNGGQEEAFPLEDRVIVPSAKVESFDLMPEMKAAEIANTISSRVKKFEVIFANIANVDMIGHTGNVHAMQDAINATDQAVKKVTEAVLKQNGTVIITADHGNAEQMVHLENEGDPETLHTLNPVPFIFVNKQSVKKQSNVVAEISSKSILKEVMTTEFTLADVAPTILEMLKIDKPEEMTGQSLLKYLK